MKNFNLLLAGPVNVSRNVKKALIYPEISHRGEEFKETYKSIKKNLAYLFCASESKNEFVVITGSGTAAMESVISSLKKSKVLVLNNGFFGERLKKLAMLHKHTIIEYNTNLKPFKLDEIEKLLTQHKDIKFVLVAHCETSIGRLNPLRRIAKLVKKYNRIIVVDAMSSLGGEDLSVDRDDIDICFSNTNKCVEGVPVLSFICIKKAIEKEIKNESNCFYLDLNKYIEYSRQNETPYTPAIPLFYSLKQALLEIRKEGLKNRINRYKNRTAYFRKCLSKFPLKIRVKEKYERSNVCSVFAFPEKVNLQKLIDYLKKCGFVIYPSRYSPYEAQISWVARTKKKEVDRFVKTLEKYLKSTKII